MKLSKQRAVPGEFRELVVLVERHDAFEAADCRWGIPFTNIERGQQLLDRAQFAVAGLGLFEVP